MGKVTRDDLVDWFGSDNAIDNLTLEDLNDELDNARQQVFEHFGFTD